jgi:hypothetical protein
MMRSRPLRLLRNALVLGVGAAVLAIPASSGPPDDNPGPGLLATVSQVVAFHQWYAHPEQAPAGFRANRDGEQRRHQNGRCGGGGDNGGSGNVPAPFNCDTIGFPQNEESQAACPTNPNLVLQGANDYNGLVESATADTTGWYWSTDGGRTVRNTGFLPPVSLRTIPNHPDLPSGGDPVDFLPAGCDATFAASLVYNADDPFGDANGVAVYRSTPQILSSCPGGDDPTCWPVKRTVAETDQTHFIDKPWMFVGTQNGVRYVWVTYSDFSQNPSSPLGYQSAQIKAVRCTYDLLVCTAPIPISTIDEDVQFSDVTIGPDGRAYITWARIDGELPGTPSGNPGQPQTFTIKERTETAPGSGVFGPEHVVYVEDKAIPFNGFLQANDFRVATYPKSDVVLVNGRPRIFVIWDACRFRLLDRTCEHPQIKLSYSLDPEGTSWTAPQLLSRGGVNYFPTISADRTGRTSGLAAAWFTHVYDPQFENRQDVVATSIDPNSGRARELRRLTPVPNDPESDPVLGGRFVGDYIEGVLVGSRYYVGYNANYRKVTVLAALGSPFDQGDPVNQQDNYLAVTAGGENGGNGG